MTLPVTDGLDGWSPSAAGGYRTRLTGLLDSAQLNSDQIEAIAASLYSRIRQNLPTGTSKTRNSDFLHTRNVILSFEMADKFELFRKELANSDRDPKTIERYQQILKTYQKWLDKGELTSATIKEFLAYLRNKGYKPNSVLLYYHGLKLFFEFLGLPLKIKLRKERKLPIYHDQGDVEALVRQAEIGLYHQTDEQKRRNKNLILVFAYTGMRKGEILNLIVDDIDFNRRVLAIRQGKGRKDRNIPIANRIIVPLREQCTGKSSKERLFDHLDARSAYRIVTGLSKACGLDGFHPHSLRHYFGTRLSEMGADLRDIQELMGHESIETTAIYLDVSSRHLRETVNLLDAPTVILSERTTINDDGFTAREP